jgi:hypothetical protein
VSRQSTHNKRTFDKRAPVVKDERRPRTNVVA